MGWLLDVRDGSRDQELLEQATGRDAPLLWLVLCNIVIGEGREIELNFVSFALLTESPLPQCSEIHFE